MDRHHRYAQVLAENLIWNKICIPMWALHMNVGFCEKAHLLSQRVKDFVAQKSPPKNKRTKKNTSEITKHVFRIQVHQASKINSCSLTILSKHLLNHVSSSSSPPKKVAWFTSCFRSCFCSHIFHLSRSSTSQVRGKGVKLWGKDSEESHHYHL